MYSFLADKTHYYNNTQAGMRLKHYDGSTIFKGIIY